MSRIIVVGAGVMGLAAAYHAAKCGHEVTVLEGAPEAGGMAAHFDLGGLSIERFYHFLCRADRPLFALLSELGLADTVRWAPTSMGYYFGGALHPWGDPVSLLRFDGLGPVEKIRYGLMMALSAWRKEAGRLETVSAREWITAWCGRRVYERMWAPLFRLKFHEYADDISAAWVWSRIKRIGTSRRSMFQEELGYIEGGSQTLITALVDAIAKCGGKIQLSVPATRIDVGDGRVKGVEAGGAYLAADAVISTVPTPFVNGLIPGLPAEARARYEAIGNIGVVCTVFRLRTSVTPYFWVNIADPRFEIPGIIEASHLRKVPDTVVYVPYYMPQTHPKFRRPDDFFRAEAFGYLKLLNPSLRDDDLVACHIGRLRYAQPICPPGFAAMLPPVQTSVAGLQVADTCFYYPEDRGISESVRLGRMMAQRVA